MELNKEQKLSKFWQHNINPITGWESTLRADKDLIKRKLEYSKLSAVRYVSDKEESKLYINI